MGEYLKEAPPRQKRDLTAVRDTVRTMLESIEKEGDAAVVRYAEQLDKWQDRPFRVSNDAIAHATSRMSETFKDDFALCLHNVQEFAKRQKESMQDFDVALTPGVTLGQKHIPIATAGCYIPGGKYPLISAAAMSVGTARVAGVSHVIGCAPPRPGEDGMFPHTLYGLHASGANEIYCIGGVQAMAAMAYGRVGMKPVDIITGPGNAFVAEAKRQLFGTVGIDLPAGPTEVCVLCDETADSELVAIDLLGQAEHGPDSPAWLVTTSADMAAAVLAAVEKALETLPTAEIARKSWADHGEILIANSPEEACELVDAYAPEHLEIQTARDDWYLDRLSNYGSVFVGPEATVAYGDKGVGTNHTLPTSGAARYTGGLWVGKFIKTVTWQKLTRSASAKLAGPLGRMCEAEGMFAHAMTCDIRAAMYRGDNEIGEGEAAR